MKGDTTYISVVTVLETKETRATRLMGFTASDQWSAYMQTVTDVCTQIVIQQAISNRVFRSTAKAPLTFRLVAIDRHVHE